MNVVTIILKTKIRPLHDDYAVCIDIFKKEYKINDQIPK